MTLGIYNTLSRKKEIFEPLQAGKVSLYVCGPTVYAAAHIGHAMSSLVFDVIRRYLEFRGYDVTHVMNYTDVDDKIIQRANEEGVDPFELAEHYIGEYRRHLDDLNILPATSNPVATREIDRIIEMIGDLVDRGYAYPAQGDVYFRVAQAEGYGKLSRRKVEDMQAGARIEVVEHKETPLDFALWKGAKPGEPAWDSPWGKGRPGWHIECSAMSLHHLGEQIDIHGGGNDLIFPHHENEIAQTESLTGKPFARYWVHNGMLQLAGEKMSKSVGNLVTIEEFLAGYEGDVIRMIVLNAGYRNPLTYGDRVAAQANRALDRLRRALRPAHPGAKGAAHNIRDALDRQQEESRQRFFDCMDDDFNTAGAMGALFDLVRASNQARDAGADAETLSKPQELLRQLAAILGLRLEGSKAQQAPAAPFVELLLAVRDEMRQEKLWTMADLIRDRLASLGVVVEDSKDGTTWRWTE